MKFKISQKLKKNLFYKNLLFTSSFRIIGSYVIFSKKQFGFPYALKLNINIAKL